jgi:hypothetical protein
MKEYTIIIKDIYGVERETDWNTLEKTEKKYNMMSLKEAKKHGIIDFWIVYRDKK